jgi:hypothetical protein
MRARSALGCERQALHMVTKLQGGVRTGGGESSRLESSTVHLLLSSGLARIPVSSVCLFQASFARPHEAVRL